MGYHIHHSIIITTWSEEYMKRVEAFVAKSGAQYIGPSTPTINNFTTLVVVPDGSKEGWAESDLGDMQREAIVKWLKGQCYEDGSSSLKWALVSITEEDEAEILDSVGRGAS